MTTLSDTRTPLTREDACSVHEQLAHCDCRLTAESARLEVAIAKAKSAFRDRTADDRILQARLEAFLLAYIGAHPDQFEKPRSIKTEFGEFGLRSVSDRLEVADEAAAIAWAGEHGHTDCLRQVTVLDRDAVKRRIKAGQAVPGCSLPSGERAYYKVAKALLEAAATTVEG